MLNSTASASPPRRHRRKSSSDCPNMDGSETRRGLHARNSSMDSSLTGSVTSMGGVSSSLTNKGSGVPLYSGSGRVYTRNERESMAKRRGVCVGCGIATHSKSLMIKTKPLTNNHVYQGTCIQCNPEKVPKPYLWEVRVKLTTLLPSTVTCAAPQSMDIDKNSPQKYPSFGGGPSGELLLEPWENHKCPGFPENTSVISMLYRIPDGIQLNYHSLEGANYDGKRIRAFLPNCPEGRELLVRIRVAFQCGYMLKIGKSVTTGKNHQTIFTDIPNKTSLDGGPHGFPDDYYMDLCHTKLDWCGIPDVQGCLEYLESPTTAGQQQQQAPDGTGEPEVSLPSSIHNIDVDDSSIQLATQERDDPEISVPGLDVDGLDSTDRTATTVTSQSERNTPLARAQVIVDPQPQPQPPQPEQQQQTKPKQSATTLLDRIQLIEQQVGIPLNIDNSAGAPSLMERIDRIEMLMLGELETKGQLLKDRLASLEDHIF